MSNIDEGFKRKMARKIGMIFLHKKTVCQH